MSKTLLEQMKGYISGKLFERVTTLIDEGDETKLAQLFDNIASIAPAQYHKEAFGYLAQLAREGSPFMGVFRRMFRNLHPNCRKKLIQNFLVNFVVLSRGIRERKEAQLDTHLPNFFVVSPTMKCNLHCKGCYASGYDTSEDLTFEELDKLFSEAKELGMYFFTLSGGEPFYRRDILDLFAKHDDCYFQVYTNGTLIDDSVADRLAELGNVAPMISVEGDKEETDYRRGEGVYETVRATFRRLREKGVLFGFSATYTSHSADHIARDEFIEEMIEAGCSAGWFFQYIPTGSKPELEYMATPEQRVYLHKKVEQWRLDYPIFLGDFWNDGKYVDGCMAGGERYMHIISNGDVEPCVFCHFAVDNIRDKPLAEVVQSPFFKAIRDAQPYDDDNLLRPCIIIDHPWVLRDLVQKHGARPTHDGSSAMLEELAPGLDQYAQELKEIYDPLWEEHERAHYERLILSREDKPRSHQRFQKHRPVQTS
ncbi:MAG: radical SAM protein [Synergistales bacterium]|nr:radical SAM protein [Synergistales bacterium]